MSQTRRLEQGGILLAVVMSSVALGLQLQQRLAASRPASVPAPTPPPAATLPPASSPEGEILPLPVPPGGKELLSKGDDLIRMQGLQGGRKQYELTAQRLVLTRDESTTVAEGIRGAVILGKDGKPTLTFSAQRATMHMVTKDLDVEGDVHVEAVDPKNRISFRTNSMRWSSREERLTCPNPVQVSQPGVFLRGGRMIADARLRRLSLEGGVYLEADAEKVEPLLGISPASRQSGGKKAASASSTRGEAARKGGLR